MDLPNRIVPQQKIVTVHDDERKKGETTDQHGGVGGTPPKNVRHEDCKGERGPLKETQGSLGLRFAYIFLGNL